MIEVFLDILTRILQNQNTLMYAELKYAEEEEARKLLGQSINETCVLLDGIAAFLGKGQEKKTKEKEIE